MKINAVTTCNAAGFRTYGRRMVESFAERWPRDATLYLFREGFDYRPHWNIRVLDLPAWFRAWKRRHQNNSDAHGREMARARKPKRGYDYRRDCVRFAHKIAALTDPAAQDCDLLLWIDADTYTHETVSADWLSRLFPGDGYMAWLDRANVYPECGFMMFRARHERHQAFMDFLRAEYESDAVFRMRETHDSYVIEQLVRRCVAEAWFPEPHGLSGQRGRRSSHPFIFSPLAECMDHAKGARKRFGRTPAREAKGRREKYWRRNR